MTWSCQSAADTLLVGIDLQQVGQVEDAVGRFGDRYLDRVYTSGEQQSAGRDPASLAGCFAAKEAVLKVLGSGDGLDPRWLEIAHDENGRPQVRLHGRAADLALALGLTQVQVSISHQGSLAAAVAIASLDGEDAGARVPPGAGVDGARG